MEQGTKLRDHFYIAIECTRAMLSDAEADALIVTSPANVQYLTGYSSWTHPMHITNQTMVILTAEGKRILLIPSTDGDFISMNNFEADEVQTYGTFYIESAETGINLKGQELHMANFTPKMVNTLNWADALYAALEAEGLSKATLAIDQGHLMPSYWELLGEKLNRAKLKDAFLLMLQVRAIKSSYEIEMLRQSSACTEAAIRSSLEIAASGATDSVIRDVFKKSLIDAGAQHLFSAIGVGTRTCFPNVQPDGTRLIQGSHLRYDVGCRYKGYASDISRIATLGPAPKKVRRYYEAMLNGEEAAIQILGPGVLACDVFEVAMEAVRKSGVPHYKRHHCGHAIGLDTYEIPVIKPNDHTPLKAGMTFCIETPYYELGFGGVQVEDMVVITDNGVELLTDLSRELFELVAK